MVQPCIWFKEEPSQISVGQTESNLLGHGEATYLQSQMNVRESYSSVLEQGTLPLMCGKDVAVCIGVFALINAAPPLNKQD